MRIALTLAASAAAAVGVLVAPAGFATADQSAAQQISQLQSEGYTVNIDRVGSGSLDNCVVTSVRNPQEFTQWVPATGALGRGGNRGDRTVLVQVVTSKTISVSLNCSR
jgi:hypothetical protein